VVASADAVVSVKAVTMPLTASTAELTPGTAWTLKDTASAGTVVVDGSDVCVAALTMEPVESIS
jgi:hypothetical protein